MSQMCVCATNIEIQSVEKPFLDRIALLAENADMFIFCPPMFVESFMKNEQYDKYLLFDLADNPNYDNCEKIFLPEDLVLMNKRIAAIGYIAHHVISMGYRFVLFIGESGAAQENEIVQRDVTIEQLRQQLKEYFTSIRGFPTTKFIVS